MNSSCLEVGLRSDYFGLGHPHEVLQRSHVVLRSVESSQLIARAVNAT